MNLSVNVRAWETAQTPSDMQLCVSCNSASAPRPFRPLSRSSTTAAPRAARATPARPAVGSVGWGCWFYPYNGVFAWWNQQLFPASRLWFHEWMPSRGKCRRSMRNIWNFWYLDVISGQVAACSASATKCSARSDHRPFCPESLPRRPASRLGWYHFLSPSHRRLLVTVIGGGSNALTVYQVGDDVVGPTPAPTPAVGGPTPVPTPAPSPAPSFASTAVPTTDVNEPQYGELGCAADLTTGVRVRDSE